jgi:transcriptional regulator with XRE-family HTH domain
MVRSHVHPRINGEKLRRMRQISGLSVTAFAEKVGCSPARISHIETGRTPGVAPAMLAKICDALGVTDRAEMLDERSAA